jgi:hypothetical protein
MLGMLSPSTQYPDGDAVRVFCWWHIGNSMPVLGDSDRFPYRQRDSYKKPAEGAEPGTDGRRDLLSVLRLVLGDDMDRDAAAVVDLQALLPGPVAYLLVLVVCGGPADAGWSAGGPGGLTGRLYVASQSLPQLLTASSASAKDPSIR